LQIILVADQLAAAKNMTVGARHLVFAGLAALALILALSALFSWLAVVWRLPFVEEQLVILHTQEAKNKELQHQKDLRAISVSLGQLQARMSQIDGLAQRLSTQTGVAIPEKTEAKTSVSPDSGKGGPFIPAQISESSLREEISNLAETVEEQGVLLGLMESTLRERMIRSELLPNIFPLRHIERISSPFGVRIDPFGRGRSIHEGIDFIAPYGANVLAVANGIVVVAFYHPEFGNMVEINHGGELITRYAHMSALNVQVGEAVRRGQLIGHLGNSGRSTGPHLHFEVRANGVPINPGKFLKY
jgi:murein DD-endopeptidase MepM/ murein hydrolase activator NlpD